MNQQKRLKQICNMVYQKFWSPFWSLFDSPFGSLLHWRCTVTIYLVSLGGGKSWPQGFVAKKQVNAYNVGRELFKVWKANFDKKNYDTCPRSDLMKPTLLLLNW